MSLWEQVGFAAHLAVLVLIVLGLIVHIARGGGGDSGGI